MSISVSIPLGSLSSLSPIPAARRNFSALAMSVFSVTCMDTFSHSGNANTSTSWKAGENSLKYSALSNSRISIPLQSI